MTHNSFFHIDSQFLPNKKKTKKPAEFDLGGSILDNSSNSTNLTLPQERLLSQVGTYDYIAPEIYEGIGHSYEVDYWSLGIILFECCIGIPPFNARNPDKIYENILLMKIPWHFQTENSSLTLEAKQLITELLVIDPMKRLGHNSAQEVKNHCFFSDINWKTLHSDVPLFIPNLAHPISTDYFEGFQTFSNLPNLFPHLTHFFFPQVVPNIFL